MNQICSFKKKQKDYQFEEDPKTPIEYETEQQLMDDMNNLEVDDQNELAQIQKMEAIGQQNMAKNKEPLVDL